MAFRSGVFVGVFNFRCRLSAKLIPILLPHFNYLYLFNMCTIFSSIFCKRQFVLACMLWLWLSYPTTTDSPTNKQTNQKNQESKADNSKAFTFGTIMLGSLHKLSFNHDNQMFQLFILTVSYSHRKNANVWYIFYIWVYRASVVNRACNAVGECARVYLRA